MLNDIIENAIKEKLGLTTPTRNIEITKPVKSIVILQRGWIVVGDLSFRGGEGIIEDASVIRQWGTTKGIGELALSGPLEKTKLDACGTVRFNQGAEVCRIDCVQEKWS